MAFALVPALAEKDFVVDLKLCRVLLEDNAYYPWIFLVPKKENVKNMMDLTMDERLQLMREIALAEKVMQELFPSDQSNVAMIGNLTPQLHVHVVCRKIGDPDWPHTVWNATAKKYDSAVKEETIMKIRAKFEKERQEPQYNQ